MSVDRINIINAPNNTIGKSDMYQFAFGMYPGSDSSTGRKPPQPYIALNMQMAKVSEDSSSKYKLDYLKMKHFRDFN